MEMPRKGKLLRIFIRETDRWGHQALYEVIVSKARELGLAGATVLRGPMGFGAHPTLHASKILRLAADLPVVIEIVDLEDQVRRLLGAIDPMISEGLVTLEDVEMIRYRKFEASATGGTG
jgi:PII-like signaling protein